MTVKREAPGADTMAWQRDPADGAARAHEERRFMHETDGAGGEMHVIDLVARRPDVVRRLIERGVPAATLQTLLPDWESVVAAALGEAATAR